MPTLIMLAVFAPPAHAGSAAKQVTKVPGVVATASKIEESVAHTGSSVTIISREDIDRRNAQTVTEMLRDVPGVTIQRSGGSPGTFSQVRIRGSNDNQVTVLVDGARVNDLFRGGGFDFGLMPTDNVERIEVVRGGASALYGSDAIGGVINIITRRGEGEPRLMLFSEGGSQSTFKEGGVYSGEIDGTDFSLSYSRLDSSGLAPGPFNRNHEQENHYSGRIGRDFGPADDPVARFQATFNASQQWFQSPFDFPGNFDFFAIPEGLPGSIQTYDPNNHEKRTFLTTTETLTVNPTDWWTTVFRFSLTQNEARTDNALDSGVPYPYLFREQNFGFFVFRPVTNFFQSDTVDTTIEAEVLNHFTLEGDNWKNVATAGYHFERNSVDFRDFSTTGNFGTLPPAHSNVQAVRNRNAHFYQDQLSLWDRLFLTAGFRVDQETQDADIQSLAAFNMVNQRARTNSLYGIQYNPRFSAAFEITEIDGVRIKLHGAYARNFHAPSFSSLFFPGFSNPALQPEVGKTSEGGVSFEALDGKLSGDVTYFRTDYEDLIVFVQKPPPIFFSLENEGNAKAEGIEVSGSAGPWKGFTVRGNHTLMDTRGDDGKALQRRPRHAYNGSLSYERDRLSVNLYVNGLGRQRDSFDFIAADNELRTGNLPWFHTAEISATYDVLRDRGPIDKLQIYTRVQNVFGSSYEEVKGFPAAGTLAFAGVRLFMF
ncbi:MAG: TonB-dependent receptor [Deltaproteobacteria bacterium]|nr:TonB-dependent receptor [Deltaproteobacteria bacterium]